VTEGWRFMDIGELKDIKKSRLGKAAIWFLLLLIALTLVLNRPPLVQLDGTQTTLRMVEVLRNQVAPPDTIITLGSSPKYTSQERTQSLARRLQSIKTEQGSQVTPVHIDESYGAPVLMAGEHSLATVLDEDLPEYYSADQSDEVRKRIEMLTAQRWQSTLQRDLALAAGTRTSPYLVLALSLAGLLLLLAIGAQWIAGEVGRTLLSSPLWTLKSLIWTLTLTLLLSLFPQMNQFGGLIASRVTRPLALFLVTLVAIYLASAVSKRVILAYFRALRETQGKSITSRSELRLETTAQALQILVRGGLVVVGFVVYLSLLGVTLNSSLTGLGAIGVAFGVLAQSAVKDAMAGLAALLQDRYGVGDWLEADICSGTVESFTLFTTRMRTTEGAVVYVSNFQLMSAKNHSKLWSRVDYRVRVAYSTDLTRAIEVLLEEVRLLKEDRPERITGQPELLGVDSLGESGITLRLWLQTTPGDHWSVRRELNQRVKERYDKEGIVIPFPQLSVSMTSPEPE
jgi:moderate conductance mechanosensitive channel